MNSNFASTGLKNRHRSQLALVLALAGALGLAGCAHYPANAPKTANSHAGYYYDTHHRKNNADDILFLMAFSGGGTRASAFSYGVLEALRDTSYQVAGKPRRLLDEVDAISSVSGGSVTAAAYGLYGDRVFEVFEPAFLKRNVELALLEQMLNPIQVARINSPTFGRSDLAAHYYDKILFKNARFEDLANNNSPYLVINSTDIDTGTRLSFTQNFFDVLSSDLGPYPLSRAVAASSAVPGVLSPITLNNYAGQYPVTPPAWVTQSYGPHSGLAGQQARALQAFMNRSNYPYLHLVDGGVSDNLGLRVYLELLSYLSQNPQVMNHPPLANVRKVVLISVNARVRTEKGWNRKPGTPRPIPTAIAADSVTMEHYSNDTLEGLDAGVEKLRRSPGISSKVKFYSVNLSFDQLREPSEASFLMSLPTTFFLQPYVVDELKTAAHTLLYQNPDFKNLLLDLGASTRSPAS